MRHRAAHSSPSVNTEAGMPEDELPMRVRLPTTASSRR